MARHFNGTTDYIDCGTSVRGADVQAVTVGAWINLDDVVGDYAAMSRWNGGSSSTWMLHVTGGKIEFRVRGDDGVEYSATGATDLTPLVGTWIHVGGTCKDQTATVYLSGASDGTATLAGTHKLNQSSGEHVFFGADNTGGGSRWFKGSIAECNVQLDVSNAAAMFSAWAQQASPKDTEGLFDFDHIGYWPILGDSPEPDVSGNVHNGTVHGTTAVDHPPVRSISAFQS